MPRSIPGRDVLRPLQSEAQSAANVVATDISPAISKVQSAASAAQSTANVVATAAISKIQSAASAATAINTAKEMIPRNCSLGTKQFCFGFYNRTECHNLPLNLSNIVPEAVATFVGDQVQALEPLPWILANIQGCLILGLVLLILVMAVILCLAKCLLRLSICIGMVIIGVAGLLCCVPFAIPTFILFAVQSKIQNLPSNIEVQKGDVSYYCLGILFCGIIMTLSAILSLRQRRWI
jgi:hypothetical protein